VVLVDLAKDGKVVLRNLQVSKQHGEGPDSGIYFRSEGQLHVENCIISGFNHDLTETGIQAVIPTGAEIVARLFVKDTIIRGNYVGVQLAGSIAASFDNCRIENSSIGVTARNTRTTISHSLVAGSSHRGIEIKDGATVYVETCVVTNNREGIAAVNTESPGPAIAYVSNTGIYGNAFGLGWVGGGAIYSFGNNRLANSSLNMFTETLSQQ
jgi:hypothetical protein